ncbi:UNVERIFIED_CONTAM: UvrD-helicase domain-containing protein [Campylobacter lari]
MKIHNIKTKPLSGDEIIQAINSIYSGLNFKDLIKLINNFISLYKQKYNDEKGFDLIDLSKIPSKYERERTLKFIEIAKDAYLQYEKFLLNQQKIDYDKMIFEAIKYIDNFDQNHYKYVIVDEFQDISENRMLLLNKIIKNGNSKLFAVGDDWQSIYRFSGSDLDYFINFKKYFGPTKISFIAKTHRNSQELQDVACKFIKQNKRQFDKTIISDLRLKNPIKLVLHDDKLEKKALNECFKNIAKINKNASILLLGRINNDIEDYLDENLHFEKHDNNQEGKIISK